MQIQRSTLRKVLLFINLKKQVILLTFSSLNFLYYTTQPTGHPLPQSTSCLIMITYQATAHFVISSFFSYSLSISHESKENFIIIIAISCLHRCKLTLLGRNIYIEKGQNSSWDTIFSSKKGQNYSNDPIKLFK